MARRCFEVLEMEMKFSYGRNEKRTKKFVSKYFKKHIPNNVFKISSQFLDSDGYGEDLYIKVQLSKKVSYNKILQLLYDMFQEDTALTQIIYDKKTNKVRVIVLGGFKIC